jgi:hypothetical protein
MAAQVLVNFAPDGLHMWGEPTISQLQVALVQALLFALIQLRITAWRRTGEPVPRHGMLPWAYVGDSPLILPEP